ncbi:MULTISPECIES: quinone oxidoreductase [Exiguobacterium]|uniref:Quinone oxidoreductase n=1 Tax=Exiguobacterium antarcticum TaxID=132920 RepID=A0ABT6R222_9BACL|nr:MULTISPECIES: quinone oxidoreductase [Exiguobacterium]MCT4780882.1 quinone oxidoreductase [Exiguobacterium soli]MDI3234996.1 quinone oxidoreductase [Exiguobacterium antarcticum]
MKALTFHSFGDSSVLTYQEHPTPELQSNEVLIEMKAIGLNFADIYRRKGNYHLEGTPPYLLGYEGSGLIVRLGDAVTDLHVGQRIAFADVPNANAEFVTAPQDKIIPLPDSISYETGASVLLQGLTAHYLTRDSYDIRPRDLVLIHAAAGGVGQLLTQIVRLRGAIPIGLTSSQEKAAIAKQNGCEHVFLYSDDWVGQLHTLTNQRGVDVVYESVGSTLMESFQATKVHGTVVFYGMAGGDPVAIDPRFLMDTSKTLTGGDLWNVLTTREERIRRAGELFSWIQSDQLRLAPPTLFPLSDGKRAHDYLESRQSTGKILLIPSDESDLD